MKASKTQQLKPNNCFILWNGTEEELKEFHRLLNSLYEKNKIQNGKEQRKATISGHLTLQGRKRTYTLTYFTMKRTLTNIYSSNLPFKTHEKNYPLFTCKKSIQHCFRTRNQGKTLIRIVRISKKKKNYPQIVIS